MADARDVAGDVLDVLIVDDHRVFADAIALAIDVEPDMRCCGAVATAEEALAAVAGACPSVVLLDVALPGANGIDAIGRLRARCPEVRVLLLTASTSAASLIAAADAGADGFLPKELPFAEVVEAIRGDDSLALDATMMGSVLWAAAQGQQPPRPELRADLTEREYGILLLLAEARTVKEIARLFGISVHTCRAHVRAVLAKLGAHSQLEAVLRAARAGLLPNLRTGDG